MEVLKENCSPEKKVISKNMSLSSGALEARVNVPGHHTRILPADQVIFLRFSEAKKKVLKSGLAGKVLGVLDKALMKRAELLGSKEAKDQTWVDGKTMIVAFKLMWDTYQASDVILGPLAEKEVRIIILD